MKNQSDLLTNSPAHRDDERDAGADASRYCSDFKDRCGICGDAYLYSAFLAGRKGMVPAAEVERLQKILEANALGINNAVSEAVAQAVKADRKRIKYDLRGVIRYLEKQCPENSSFCEFCSMLSVIEKSLNPKADG